MKIPPIEVVKKLTELYEEIDALRKQHGISNRGDVIWKADLNSVDDRYIIVVAEGDGSATCSQVSGNFPVDYMTESSKDFSLESDARKFAKSVIESEFGDGDFDLACELWDQEPSQGN